MMTAGIAARPLKAIKVEAGSDRFDAALDIAGWRFECKLSGKDTGGYYCIYDTVRTVKGGPPLHVHHQQDEWFYVREGEFLFHVGGDTFHLKPGDSLFGPRGVPHAFASLTDRSAVVVTFQPAGAVEALFGEASALSRTRPLTPDDWRALVQARGIDIVGPPLVLPQRGHQ
jgi:mannose-6-phosphate isomerase-like protein (cupin superfamily)